ncbi:MAG: SMP-30/gluconolactonase/LRE family protein, partial [Planctomycetota bacterium]
MYKRTNLKNWLVISMFLVAVLPCVFCSVAYGQPWDGNGVEGDPYQIWTAEDMQAIGADSTYWDAHFELMADINLLAYSGTSFNIIGKQNLEWPHGVAVDETGEKIYWTDWNLKEIRRANLDGSAVEEVVTTGLNRPFAIALDGVGRKMYWTDHGTSKIQRGNLDGSSIEDLVTTGLVYPFGIAVDGAGGKMYWTDYDTQKIQCANLDGSDAEVLVTGLGGIRGISLDVSAGKMYWADSSGGKIQRANLNGSSVQTLVTGLSYPQGIALDAANGKMYWTASHAGKVQRANLNGSNVQDLVTGLSYPAGIALDVANGKIYFADRAGSKILRANLDGSGLEDHITKYFRGVFDGNGHTISNFQYSSTGKGEIGLFSFVVGETAEIRDLGLIEANVQSTSGKRVGSLVGNLFDGTVRNCWAKRGSVSGGDWWTGGLVGLNIYGIIIDCHTNIMVSATGVHVGGLTGDNSGTIKNCYALGDVSGNGYVGGLSGYNYKGRISQSFAVGDVSGTSWCLGGLLGLNQEGEISNCYAMGNISGTGSYNGGLVGFNGDYASSLITRCYSKGTVTGGSYTGGLVGDTRSGARVTASFWDTESSGLTISDGGTGLPTALMQTESTFTDAGWDFVGEVINGANDVWQMCASPDYPKLWWEECLEPAILANVEIKPETLNLQSKGRWVTCYIWLPEDYNVADIEPNSILLEDEVPAERVWLGDEFAIAKFSRGEVQEMLGEVETPGEVELVVSGEL